MDTEAWTAVTFSSIIYFSLISISERNKKNWAVASAFFAMISAYAFAKCVMTLASV